MKCKNCGAELTPKNDGIYFCEYCQSKYKIKVSAPTNAATNKFVIIGGVLKSYSGNETDIVIPEGVMSIGPNAFNGNLLIKNVKFPSSLTSIDNNAFENCVNLINISNYENVVYFKDECFRNTGLKEITIYPNVLLIGKYAFSYMQNLKVVNYKPKNDLKLKGTFLRCPKLETVNMDRKCFFPSIAESIALRNNVSNNKPTWGDAFIGTPYIHIIYQQYMDSYKKGICPECGGQIKKSLFHAKCSQCGIDFKN